MRTNLLKNAIAMKNKFNNAIPKVKFKNKKEILKFIKTTKIPKS